MVAFTYLHQCQHTSSIACQHDTLLFDTEHRRRLSATTLFLYHCDLLVAGMRNTGPIDVITLVDSESYLKVLDKVTAATLRPY